MMLRIKNLHASASLGIYEWEKQAARQIIVNLAIRFEALRAAAEDDIAASLDYAEVEQSVLRIALLRHYNLIESLVAAIGTGLLEEFPQMLEVTVEVDKPGALRHAESVSVSDIFSR